MNQEVEKYRHLLENLPDPFAYHQVVTGKEGDPADYIFLEVNTAFEEMIELKRNKVIGKKVTGVHPDIKDSSEETYKKADRAMYTDKLKCSRKARNMIITLLLDSLHKRSDLSDGEREQVEEISLRMSKALSISA